VDDDGKICVQQTKRGTIASLALKKHDVVMGVNGASVVGLSLSEVVGMLAEARSGSLEIEIERVLPRIVVMAANEELDFDATDPEDEQCERGFRELVAVLRDPPDSLTQEQVMAMIHVFQEIVSQVRRGEANVYILKAVMIEFPITMGEMTEQAAAVVHRAIRYGIEDENSEQNPARSGDEEDSLLRDVLDEIFSG
jgi:hypothetical protein